MTVETVFLGGEKCELVAIFSMYVTIKVDKLVAVSPQ